jgi:hypothetical protein
MENFSSSSIICPNLNYRDELLASGATTTVFDYCSYVCEPFSIIY